MTFFKWVVACCFRGRTAAEVLVAVSLFGMAGDIAANGARAGLGSGPPATERVYTGKPGPWGQLEYTRISIAPPEESIQLTSETVFQRAQWAFVGMPRQQVENLFRTAKLSEEQLTAMLRGTPWQEFPGATLVQPERELVMSLSPVSRHHIYGILGRMQENPAQAEPFVFHPEHLQEVFTGSGVSTETITTFKRLLYTHGRILLFADADALMSTIPSYDERLRFMRSISRRFTLLVKLVVPEGSSVGEIAEYWGYKGRPKELGPLLESLTRVPGGAKIDLAHMMPQFARKRIYTFPPVHQGDTIEAKRNCHWSALNFFNETADDRFCEPSFIQETVLGGYDRVTTGPLKMGDLLVLADSRGDTIHSAVYLADDVVYTKNGAGPTQPWLYMHLPEVLDLYASSETAEDPLQMLIFRRRETRAAVEIH